MRSTPVLLTLIALATGATGASASLSLPVDREVGTLTCSIAATPAADTRSETSADCVFVSDRDDATQSYAGQVRWQRGHGSMPTPARIAWRVLTRKGVEKPGMLAGAYADPATWQVAPVQAGDPVLMGSPAKLRQRIAVGVARVIEPQPVIAIALSVVSAIAAR